jgi:hypothetical protein
VQNGQGGGILAAAIGLYHQVSMRISGGGGAPEPPAQPEQQQPPPLRLSVDDFERAIELLEKAHYEAVKAWWEEEQAGESGRAASKETCGRAGPWQARLRSSVLT